ncbi:MULTISPECIES: cytochrome c oxidase subunit 4 [unclassified Streptomyces]|uniref:aa3-type cytochrome oxidase subunit IV n=1 Tax=unclassified Streptomyces TaxID=2593676 RepID=UPI0013713B93|nr:cytochrome c oxidase subunit 4 [Streptomyces sp. SHP 1-2]MCW5252080.1 cytochrome c oxidase subunit 4 [Streptomyces sp. SHP 1-2]MYU24835.1 cytochrome c oxidase subunit 4 [Streptomyces sp. SID8352]
MRTEARLFTGVAVFFASAAVLYGWWSAEPVGTVALTVAFLMALVIAFFLRVQHRRHGTGPQDRGDAETADGTGPLGFFAPHSPWPLAVALGAAVVALGVVFGLWLALIGCGLLALAVPALVLQYAGRGTRRHDAPPPPPGQGP